MPSGGGVIVGGSLRKSSIIVGNNALPEPSEMDVTIADIVKTNQNSNGVLSFTVVNRDVVSIELKWYVLTDDMWHKILANWQGSGKFAQNVTFVNPSTNEYEKREMYISDRTASVLYRSFRDDNVKTVYRDCGLSLIDTRKNAIKGDN